VVSALVSGAEVCWHTYWGSCCVVTTQQLPQFISHCTELWELCCDNTTAPQCCIVNWVEVGRCVPPYRRAWVQIAPILPLQTAKLVAALGAWLKVMAVYRRVYDSRHLQADCQEPGSAPEPYTLGNRVWATFTLLISKFIDILT